MAKQYQARGLRWSKVRNRHRSRVPEGSRIREIGPGFLERVVTPVNDRGRGSARKWESKRDICRRSQGMPRTERVTVRRGGADVGVRQGSRWW